MKRWKPELAVVVLTLVLSAFAGGYFFGRSTVSSGEPVVLTARSAPAQETALTAPEKKTEEQQTSAEPEKPAGGLIDINAADAETLATLPGIGRMLAERIVAYREENGPFTSPEELMEVDGVGEKKLANIIALITVGG